MLSPGLTMQGLVGPMDETYLSLTDDEEDKPFIRSEEVKSLSGTDSSLSDLSLQHVLSSRNQMIHDLLSQI
jgi:hypothetical protein